MFVEHRGIYCPSIMSIFDKYSLWIWQEYVGFILVKKPHNFGVVFYISQYGHVYSKYSHTP